MEGDLGLLARSFRHDPELIDTLPVRPSLLPGILAVPLGSESLMLIGGSRHVIFRGKSSRGQLLRLLPLLDGKSTTSELAIALDDLSEESVFDVLCLLYSNGLVSDGATSVEAPHALFAARNIGHSRQHPNGDFVAQRVAQTRLLLGCDPSQRDLLLRELAEAGFADVFPVDLRGATHSAIKGDFDVALVAGERGQDKALLDQLWSKGVPAFRVQSAQDLEIGPLILPGRSACPTCIDRQAEPKPIGQPRSKLRLALGVHRFAMLWSLLSNNDFHNGALVFSQGMRTMRWQKIVRLPDCPTCGIDSSAHWTDDSIEVFQHHYRSELVPKAFLSPSYHLSHYSEKNISHTKGKISDAPLWNAVPFTSAELGERLGNGYWLVRFAKLLELGFGLRPSDSEGFRMRYVPSGGGLDSPTPYLAVRNVEGMGDGIYRYHPSIGALEPVPAPSGGMQLLSEGPAPQITLYVLADQERIATKYTLSAARICCLDAGVSLANVAGIARALGLKSRFTLSLDSATILSALNMPRTSPVAFFPTYAAAFGDDPDFPSLAIDTDGKIPEFFDPVALTPIKTGHMHEIEGSWTLDTALIDAVITRRTSRSFSQRGVSRPALQALVDRCYALLPAIAAADTDPGLCIIVQRGADGLQEGVYRSTRDAPALSFLGPSDLPAKEYLNQSSLAAAPILIFPTTNLYDAVMEGGYGGYRNALIGGGAMAGTLWIASTELGLAGCVAGGLIESAVRLSTGIDGYSCCPMVAYVVGYRPEAQE